jgi:hypothetical protein
MNAFFRKRLYFAALAVAALSACGGGSGSSTPAGPNVANTANSSYLPLAAGNTWTFNSGGKIVDSGRLILACNCPQNGKSFESHDFYNPSGQYAGSFVLGKGLWPLAGPLQGHKITYLVGTSSNYGATITLGFESFDGTIPGNPMIDDTPTTGEYFTATAGASSTTTTITSVGGIQAYGANQVINNIANTLITGTGITTPVALAMARGVGYTSLSSNGATAQLTNFTVDAVQSQSLRRGSAALPASAGETDPNAIIAAAIGK